jgi:hypothetical protein
MRRWLRPSREEVDAAGDLARPCDVRVWRGICALAIALGRELGDKAIPVLAGDRVIDLALPRFDAGHRRKLITR